MNILPIVSTLKASAEVTALLGSNPLRVYEDIAPHKTPHPYAIWSVVTANPQNNLDAVTQNRSWAYVWRKRVCRQALHCLKPTTVNSAGAGTTGWFHVKPMADCC